ncbi:MAG: hypothetical protein M1822_007435 [Bathelium mastoideum]|nr:MAG: hypothetical protein M1822_007435 [Bathelium mastoideum]
MEGYDFDRGTVYISVGWTLTSIMLVAVLLRLYTRTLLTRSIGSDDFAICIGTCISISSMIQEIWWYRAGAGKHESLLNQYEISQVNRWALVDWVLVFISFFFVRSSVMLFVLRLLPPGKVWETRAIFVAFFFNFAITVVATVSYSVHCIPFQAAWEDIPGARCKSIQVVTVTQRINGVLSCAIDITTAIIPQFLLWKVQMKRKTKLSLDIIFALGLITAALSIGRVATMNYGVWAEDSSWRGMPSDTFTMVEEKCGIIFASAPALRQFYAYVRRVHTGAPTKDRQYPDEDFTRFRRRVNLRDIFWYRQPSLINGRVIRPQQIFHPPSSDQTKNAELVVPRPEMESVDEASKKSMLDVINRRTRRIFGGHVERSTEKSGALSTSKSSDNTLRTRLWHWNSLGSQSNTETTSQDCSGSERSESSG